MYHGMFLLYLRHHICPQGIPVVNSLRCFHNFASNRPLFAVRRIRRSGSSSSNNGNAMFFSVLILLARRLIPSGLLAIFACCCRTMGDRLPLPLVDLAVAAAAAAAAAATARHSNVPPIFAVSSFSSFCACRNSCLLRAWHVIRTVETVYWSTTSMRLCGTWWPVYLDALVCKASFLYRS